MVEIVQEGTATTTVQELPFSITYLDLLINDSEDTSLQFSFYGNTYKTLLPNEFIKDKEVNVSKLYIKTASGTASFRAWGIQE